MHVGVPSVIALLWVMLVSGCAGNEIAPAESAAAPAPGDSSPVAALYAAPADVAFFTVSDIRADIVGPGDVPFATLYGYGYAAEGAQVSPLEDLALALTEADAVAPPFNVDVDLDAFFASAIDASVIDDHAPVVWERAPEMQRAGWDSLSPPPDAK